MFENPLINAFATLIITVGVVALLLYFVKKYSGKFTNNVFTNKQIKIEAKQALSTKTYVYIVNIEGRRFALGANDNSITKITELDTAEDKVNKENNSDDFSIPADFKGDISFSTFLKQSLLKQK